MLSGATCAFFVGCDPSGAGNLSRFAVCRKLKLLGICAVDMVIGGGALRCAVRRVALSAAFPVVRVRARAGALQAARAMPGGIGALLLGGVARASGAAALLVQQGPSLALAARRVRVWDLERPAQLGDVHVLG